MEFEFILSQKHENKIISKFCKDNIPFVNRLFYFIYTFKSFYKLLINGKFYYGRYIPIFIRKFNGKKIKKDLIIINLYKFKYLKDKIKVREISETIQHEFLHKAIHDICPFTNRNKEHEAIEEMIHGNN